MQHGDPPSDSLVWDLETLEWLMSNGQEFRAYRFLQQGDYEKARCQLEPLAAEGSVWSLFTLGWLYESGNLGSPDLNTAVAHYARGAELGDAEAQFRAGRLLVNLGAEQRARSVFAFGAEAGSISCSYWLGRLQLEGRGGAADISEGLTWLRRACSRGHLYAKRDLILHEFRSSRVVLRRIYLWLRLAKFSWQVGKEAWKNPESELLR